MHELSIAVVGIGYSNRDGSNRQFAMRTMEPGDPVELRREPRNPFDPHAVAAFNQRGEQFGYLPAERAPFIGSKLLKKRDVKAVFQEQLGKIAVIRVSIDGGDPKLPAPREQASDEEPVFWPDPEGSLWGC